MRTLALAWFLLSLSVVAGELRVAVGMPMEKALTIIKANSGKDITPGLAVVGPNGAHSLHGFYWSLEAYKTVIAVSGKEKVEWLTYWTQERISVKAKIIAQRLRNK